MVVFGALIVVILLLFLVVYENSTLLRGIGSWLGRMVRRRNQADQVVALITAGDSAVEDDSAPPDPLEAALDRISRLEKEVTEISERTQGISEDMKDVVGALRISIDGLTSRLDQVDGAMADIHLTVKPLPQNVQDATDGIQEVSSRVERISADLQRTLGYAIQKVFKCQSCGSEGFVANQVLCSKCGNESWWGWWPRNEDRVENEVKSEGNPVEEIGG